MARPVALLRRSLFAGLVLAAILTAMLYGQAVAEPVVRRAELILPGAGPDVTLLLVSDIHVAGPDMPPDRLARIIDRMNTLRPDLVLIAGDLVSDKRVATRHYPLDVALAPLAGLRPRIGSYAVLGNHDYWRDAAGARAALAAAGVQVLDNRAAQAGPVALGGVDDAFTGHADLAATVAAMRTLQGPRVLLSHSPDVFPELPGDVALTLAGHTHCGQIRLPFVGAPTTMSRFGDRYACGRVEEGGKTLIVSAGLGTSLLPFRLGAPPDMWLIRLHFR